MWWLLALLGLSSAFPSLHPEVDVFTRPYSTIPPHCAKTPITLARGSKAENSEGLIRRLEMQFLIGLQSTVCFRLEGEGNHTEEGSSWLHTVSLARLEHHHPVSQKYNFGIPEVHADCFCECDSANTHCSAKDYKYTECPRGDLSDPHLSCYRTFFPNEAITDCPAGSQPKLCCDVKFKPYLNKTYTAVKLEQPSTFATFTYVAYDYEGGKWVEKDRNTMRTQIDGGSQEKSMDKRGNLRLVVSALGATSHKLDSGMYFADSNPGGEMESLRKMPLNEATSNNFDQLGWYRQATDGKFYVKSGANRLQSIHTAKVINCKAQEYNSSLLASFYVPGSFNWASPLEREVQWIQRASLYDGNSRHVIVSHSEGVNLHVTLQVSNGNSHLHFIHNSSRMNDFTGTVVLDAKSNRYLNLSVSGASGKLNGVVKASQNVIAPELHSFTVYVHEVAATNRSLFIPLPAMVDEGRKLVCMRAEDQKEEDAVCHVLKYEETPLEVDMVNNQFIQYRGACPECNPISSEGLFKFFNPMYWIGGLDDAKSSIMVVTNIFIYIAFLIIIYFVLTKLIIPICQCCICPLVCMKLKAREERRTDKRRQKNTVVDGQFV